MQSDICKGVLASTNPNPFLPILALSQVGLRAPPSPLGDFLCIVNAWGVLSCTINDEDCGVGTLLGFWKQKNLNWRLV